MSYQPSSHPANLPDFEDVLDGLKTLTMKDGALGIDVDTYRGRIAKLGAEVFETTDVDFALKWDRMMNLLDMQESWR